MNRILKKLEELYGKSEAQKLNKRIEEIIKKIKFVVKNEKKSYWNEKDIALITYADSFREKSTPPLKTLNSFLNEYIKDSFSIVHILPFFPYSSDRGFSVIDFSRVEPSFGSWKDIAKIAKNYRLMADLVLNHVSTKSRWFQRFLKGNKKYWHYFIHFSKDSIPHEKLKKVFRPRPTPLLTPFQTVKGERYVWTTFSVSDFTDQVDLNYQNPQVLLEIITIFIKLLERGVRIFRLDAVAYIWKKLGTYCKHLPQVHTIISLMREILNRLCPSALIITETNVSYKENILYFGDGRNEAQLIYNFSLPGLVLHSFYTGDASKLTSWAKVLKPPSSSCTYFNFLDTHDGIGILGAKGILSEEEIENIFKTIKAHGGKLSYRSLPDGSKTVYEMNSTWWSALNKKDGQPFAMQLKKFITSRAISFALKGIPAVYYLSLVGGENDQELLNKTGVNRDINRTNLDLKEIARKRVIFDSMLKLCRERQVIKAFHPNASQKVLFLNKKAFVIIREYKKEKVFACHNVSSDKIILNYQGKKYELGPYEYKWVKL